MELPYCESHEKIFKSFIKILHVFTGSKYTLSVKWITRNLRSLFQLKDEVKHISLVIYEGTCSCGLVYIGETKRNFKIRQGEHENANTGDTACAKHLSKNIDHSFTWKILNNKAPVRTRCRKNLEAFYIAIKKPILNEQVKSNTLILFRNGIT